MTPGMFHIVLVEPRYDGNVGSVARVMKNFGFRNLVVVNGPEIGPEGRKNSMHALDILQKAERVKTFEELTGKFDLLIGTTAKCGGDANNLRTPVFPDELAKAFDSTGKIGLLFGREDYGLLNPEIDQCDMLVTIPASREYPTLNLSHSVAIILYELAKEENRRKASGKKYKLLNQVEKDTLLRYYDGLVDIIRDQEFEQTIAKRTFRQLIGRAFMSGREAKTMTGVFRKAMERKRRD
jgi:tRNA/rRNA methyltransferase